MTRNAPRPPPALALHARASARARRQFESGRLTLEPALRAEWLSAARLADLAGELALRHGQPAHGGGHQALATRLADNAAVLADAYRVIADAARRHHTVTPAAEWFLDNFHLIEDHLEVARRDMALLRRQELPVVLGNEATQAPRILVLADAFIAHTDSGIDAESLHAFLAAYQAHQSLSLAELWALPAILRHLLLENLRRLGVRVAASHLGRETADAYADLLLAAQSAEEAATVPIPSPLRSGDIPPAFTTRLVQRFQSSASDSSLLPSWLAERLAARGSDVAHEVEQEYRSQVAANQSVRNAFVSLNLISTFDWPRFVESHSVVDGILADAGEYAAMDFATRDAYRSAIQRLARASGRPEGATARRVVELSQATTPDAPAPQAGGPGHYLLGAGRAELEFQLGIALPWGWRARRALRAHAVPLYLFALALLTIACLTPALLASHAAGTPLAGMLLLSAFAAFPASDLASQVIHRVIARCVRPSRLPRLDFANGIPAHCRTLVAVPTLLIDAGQIGEQLAILEQHYLANAGGEVCFALLSDWRDADTPTRADDDALLCRTQAGIDDLNARYPAADPSRPRFLLFHRQRRWSTTQQRWMGWERKRGKLEELNRLLLGARDTSFVDVAGRVTPVPADVRYVLTLDADTRMPYGTVARLAGTAAHPLNRPVFGAGGTVIAGYALFQPRVTPLVASRADDSAFQRIYAGPSGLDPYAGAVSDLYQDLFDEGSYTGKGLYDLVAFDAALRGRIEPETVLSHDLLESLFARCALVSDVEVFEEFPSHAEVAAARLHRWTRGDWQLLPWAFGHRGRRFALLGRWKLIDNLRRSLSAPATLATLVAAWAVPYAPTAWWIGLVAAAIFMSTVLAFVGAFLPRRDLRSLASQWPATLRAMLDAGQHGVMTLCLLPHYAWLTLDAIVRTLYRLAVSRRHLLEWLTAAQAKNLAGFALGQFVWPLRGATVVTLTATVIVLAFNPANWRWAMPFVIVWWASPLVALLISLPTRRDTMARITPPERAALRAVARRSWGYFETFVTAAEHHLPPDNFQDDPAAVIAHRTSPTNIGLYLLSAVAAHDLGWLARTELAARLEATLDSIGRLQRHRGHLYNWYDTLSATALPPHYVSTVDSGNLAGHLLVLAQACAEYREHTTDPATGLLGSRDTLYVLQQSLTALAPGLADTTLERARQLDAQLAATTDATPVTDIVWERLCAAAVALRDSVERTVDDAACQRWARAVVEGIATWRSAASLDADAAATLAARYARIEATARRLYAEMDFQLLYDTTRELFSIGLRVDDNTLDPSHYDLLASEARLTSFIAVASGAVTPVHWWRLGRSLTPITHDITLLSWSGSMFEYLMPDLIMEAPAGSLLDRACRCAVRHQIAYGRRLGLPWGISESAYNLRDPALNYQYKAFGAPLLGLKRGLADDTVVAPYATALAVAYDPRAALANFARLDALGARLDHGYADAVDFTPGRMPADRTHVVVRTCMAHHQGMSIVALANALDDNHMRRRFHREPVVRAAELLLQERVPRLRPPPRRVEADLLTPHHAALASPSYRRYASAHTAIPTCQLLSNGSYTTLVSTAGGGFSQWRGKAVTRWRADGTCDAWGSHLYLRERQTAKVWSPTLQPTGVEPADFEAVFADDAVRFVGTQHEIEMTLEIVVSPEDDAEIRHLILMNRSRRSREIEVTSYAELVLAPAADDTAHPAFSNLFVATEFDPVTGCLLAVRHSRLDGTPELHAAQVLAGDGRVLEYETDRGRFLGRGNTPRNPDAMRTATLGNTLGAVLDPIFALRTRLVLAPNVAARLSFTTVVAVTRAEVMALADKYAAAGAHERAASLAWTHARVRLHHLGLAPGAASDFQQLAGSILYGDPGLRAGRDLLHGNRLNARALWRLGIGGDLPLVLVRVDSPVDQRLVHETMQAHQYLREKGVAFDLVVLDEEPASYALDFFHALEALAQRHSVSTVDHGPAHGRITVLRATLLADDEIRLLRAIARVEFAARHGPLAEQLPRRPAQLPPTPPPVEVTEVSRLPTPRPPLQFDNGTGGFSTDGDEYVIVLEAGATTPAPWVNVIANPEFGTIVSASGSAFSWAFNSRENQLTPWSNDAVSEPTGEALYVQDEDSGIVWSPTPAPCHARTGRYECRHGQGYSRFLHEAHGIRSVLTVFVAPDDPVKYSVLELENLSGGPRRLRVTSYAEWVLGAVRAGNAPCIVTSRDAASGALLASNTWNGEFVQHVAFAVCHPAADAHTCDRAEFIGRNGTLAAPRALHSRRALGRSTGAGFDPCAVLQSALVLGAGARRTFTVALGQAADREAALSLVGRIQLDAAATVLDATRARWRQLLTQVQIATPDRALDLMVNRWLPYQVLSCRLWARAGFYQAGGAYGFRDQLQDSMAVINIAPTAVRAHLLRCASCQFVQGDVQHWWHPPAGRGVRTHCSDDRLWLPFVTAQYVGVTGDREVLDETVGFLDGPPLAQGEADAYFEPATGTASASLYEHGARAIDVSLGVGAHGLPLMGSGDWNDGMSKVGIDGTGESVWLGWFLYLTLQRYVGFADTRGDEDRARRWRAHAVRLAASLDAAWDGAWYRRAYFDDGTPLGSASNDECRIDSIAQSWAVISGAAPAARAATAMASVERWLLRPPGEDLMLLFTPPFAAGDLQPGYIRGYPAGVRENGGQYTHAAAWCVVASALQRNGARTAEWLRRLNPINHADTGARAKTYRVEPYVIAADVYAVAPHVRRGGWTWYTGAAAWMYRAVVEYQLGLTREGQWLVLAPCLPASWPACSATWRHGNTLYRIEFRNPQAIDGGDVALTVDGLSLVPGERRVPLNDDGAVHHIDVLIIAALDRPTADAMSTATPGAARA